MANAQSLSEDSKSPILEIQVLVLGRSPFRSVTALYSSVRLVSIIEQIESTYEEGLSHDTEDFGVIFSSKGDSRNVDHTFAINEKFLLAVSLSNVIELDSYSNGLPSTGSPGECSSVN